MTLLTQGVRFASPLAQLPPEDVPQLSGGWGRTRHLGKVVSFDMPTDTPRRDRALANPMPRAHGDFRSRGPYRLQDLGLLPRGLDPKPILHVSQRVAFPPQAQLTVEIGRVF